jgi:putative phosphoesterase
MDESALKESLPRERIVDVEDAHIGLVHIPGPAVGREARLSARFPNCEAVVYGHTHVPQAERFGGVWMLNPGSPTERRRAATRSMLLLDVEGKMLRPRVVPLM